MAQTPISVSPLLVPLTCSSSPVRNARCRPTGAELMPLFCADYEGARLEQWVLGAARRSPWGTSLSRVQLMASDRPFDFDVEFDEAIEQRRFPVQARHSQPGFAFNPALQQSEPRQGSENA